ncbi:MAG: nuclear transport factor 2 family protein [Gammaproteobacteria bacterium]
MEYATPDEAEDAFYDAFSRYDLDAMMAIWMNADHIECIHPGAARLQGMAAIRYSWQQIFNQGEHLHFQIIRHHCTQAGNLAIHSVSEQIQSGDAASTMHAEVIATNIYELTNEGWRMILHHASPAQVSRTTDSTMH